MSLAAAFVLPSALFYMSVAMVEKLVGARLTMAFTQRNADLLTTVLARVCATLVMAPVNMNERAFRVLVSGEDSAPALSAMNNIIASWLAINACYMLRSYMTLNRPLPVARIAVTGGFLVHLLSENATFMYRVVAFVACYSAVRVIEDAETLYLAFYPPSAVWYRVVRLACLLEKVLLVALLGQYVYMRGEITLLAFMMCFVIPVLYADDLQDEGDTFFLVSRGNTQMSFAHHRAGQGLAMLTNMPENVATHQTPVVGQQPVNIE